MWKCSKCREEVDAQFEVCWNCGTSADGKEDPKFVSEGPSHSQNASIHKENLTCSKCASKKVIPSVRILDQQGKSLDDQLAVEIDRNPNAWLFKGSERSELVAHICGDCGYAELFVSDPGALWNAFLERNARE